MHTTGCPTERSAMKRIRKQTVHNRPVQANATRRGAILVLIAVCLPVILIVAAFSVDVAYMQLTRTELQIATDAAARAGGRTLSITQDLAAARAAAIQAAANNTVAGESLLLLDSDVEFGASTRALSGRYVFDPTVLTDEINSVKIKGDRTMASASGPIPLMFSAIPGHKNFEPRKTAVSTQLDRDIALVLDRSGSMTRSSANVYLGWTSNQPVPTGCRFNDLRVAVDAFMAELASTPQDELVSLATFATGATLDIDLSANTAPVTAHLTALAAAFPGGSTAIGDGMDDGMQALLHPSKARRFAVKTIVVMTDGQHNNGSNPEDVALLVHQNHGAIVHTVTFGDGADITRMQLTAQNGGGKHYHATDAASLTAAFQEIARNLPTLLTD